MRREEFDHDGYTVYVNKLLSKGNSYVVRHRPGKADEYLHRGFVWRTAEEKIPTILDVSFPTEDVESYLMTLADYHGWDDH